MKRSVTFFTIIACLCALASCTNSAQDKTNWEITLKSTDKNPYGTYLAFQSLQYYFPKAKTEALSTGFRYNDLNARMKESYYAGHALLILEGMYFYLNDLEWDELKQFIGNGNEVVIFCSWLDTKIEEELNCHKQGSGNEVNRFYISRSDFDNFGTLSLLRDPLKNYGYDGRSLKGFFSFEETDKDDSTANDTIIDQPPIPDTLGYADGRVNFVRYKIGNGHLTLHAAPLALSNFFLLQDGNEQYLTGLWQTLPQNINYVYWNDFYLRDARSSTMDILWKHPATRYALLLAILALTVYVLFESKRKQRIIPVIAPLKNDSVSFAETVGRLYYNRGDHTNLAHKMIQQFLEWVRAHYFLNTNLIDEHFIVQLAIKSGQPEITVRALTEMIHEVKTHSIAVDDAYLYQLYTTIRQFYK